MLNGSIFKKIIILLMHLELKTSLQTINWDNKFCNKDLLRWDFYLN